MNTTTRPTMADLFGVVLDLQAAFRPHSINIRPDRGTVTVYTDHEFPDAALRRFGLRRSCEMTAINDVSEPVSILVYGPASDAAARL